MGSVGLALELRRTGDGDVVDLFYELKEWLLERVWNVTSSLTGFASYLGSEEFRTWMADRWNRTETHLWYAFWEDDVESAVVDYAIHVASVCVATASDEVAEIAGRHGFAIEPTGPAADAFHGRYTLHGSTRMCKVLPWRRGEPVDAAPRFACEEAGSAHRGKPPSATQLRRLRASAMTGLCPCKLCKAHRGRPDPLSDQIPRAWQALDADAVGAELAARADDDAASASVLADWLEERGATLAPVQLVALARSYRDAEPIG